MEMSQPIKLKIAAIAARVVYPLAVLIEAPRLLVEWPTLYQHRSGPETSMVRLGRHEPARFAVAVHGIQVGEQDRQALGSEGIGSYIYLKMQVHSRAVAGVTNLADGLALADVIAGFYANAAGFQMSVRA